VGRAGRFASVGAAKIDEGLERRVASSPSPQHLPSEGPVRLSHLVPKTSLDGGDAALARSGSVGFFDVTVDGRVLLDCGLPEASCPMYKKGGSSVAQAFFPFCASRNPSILKLFARSPAFLLSFIGDLARVKQTARRRRRYVAIPSSSSAASTPLVEPSSEDTFSDLVAVELHPGHTVEFGVSGISSARVQDMQQLGYFGSGVGRVPGVEEIPEPKGELVVFEAFFTAGLRLPAHRFVVEVLQRYEVQIHQLTPNAVVALAKYVWAVTSYGGQPSVEVFAKNYCLHWQKRKVGNKIAQFGSCTFTPRTGKTSTEVVELVPCTRNKWGNWHDYWFYVAGGAVEDLPGLPVALMCSHCYVAFPQYEVAEGDSDEEALHSAARMSSGRDLVVEFISYGVWPLAHGWALGEVCPRQMLSLGDQLVRSPAFALDLRGRDPAAFVREAEDGDVRFVGRYVPSTEALRSWDICGSNVRLNRVFELNCLPYDDYPGDDTVDRRGQRPVSVTEEGPSQEAAPTTKKRKIGTVVGGLGVSDSFAVELMGTCAALGGRMSSPELRESSARMLEVTGGRWPKNVLTPRAAGEDFITSRMARDLKVFPYERNIAAIVSAVMEKDRQDAAQKRRAVVRIGDPLHEAKKVRGSVKAAAPGSSKPMPTAKLAATGHNKASASAKAAASSASKPPPGGPVKERRLPSPMRTGGATARVADFDTDISVVDYFVGKFF
jgi:hypothetical protein